jgi:hypothetical protein
MASDESTLTARREALLRRSAELRSGIRDDAAAIANHLRGLDKASMFLRSGNVRIAVCGVAVLLLFAGPGGALRVAGRAAILWSLVRRWLPRAALLRRGTHRV